MGLETMGLWDYRTIGLWDVHSIIVSHRKKPYPGTS